MTLVSDSYASRNKKFLDDVHGLIRDAMNEGDFSKVHPDIIEISYWNRKTFANVVVESPPDHSAQSTMLPVYSGPFLELEWQAFYSSLVYCPAANDERKKANGIASIARAAIVPPLYLLNSPTVGSSY